MREGTQRRVEAIDYQLKTRDRTRNAYDFRSVSRSFLPPSRVGFHRNTRIGTSREKSARGMSESKTERERKAGGENVCACTCGERSAKWAGEKEREKERKERKDACERTKVRK